MIKDLEVGHNASGVYIVRNVSQNTSKNGEYLNIDLADKSGEINAKKWSIAPNDLNVLKVGNIVRIDGDVTLFKDTLQIKILDCYNASSEDPNYEDVILVSPHSFSDMVEELNIYIESIEDEDYKLLLKTIFKNEEVYKKYIDFPAAVKNHHNFLHGILHHSLSMCHLVDAVIKNYEDINRSLLLAGTILHDLGKIVELSGPVGTIYTKKGLLLGHLLIGVEMIDKIAKEINIDDDKVLLLEHLIASHHGKREYGAIVEPLTKEALILSFVDDFDAKMMALDNALENTKKDSFSERIFALDNRSFYKE